MRHKTDNPNQRTTKAYGYGRDSEGVERGKEGGVGKLKGLAWACLWYAKGRLESREGPIGKN